MPEEEESIDQPLEESVNDQPESPEEEEVVEDQPEEESYYEVNGEQVSASELVKGYMRNADYTRKTQELSRRQQEMEAVRKEVTSKPESDLTEEQKGVLDFLKKNGVVTKDELDRHFKAQNAAQADMQKFNSWLNDEKPEPEIAEAVYNLGKTYKTMAYEDIYKKFFNVKKVVAKKVVGIKGKKSTSVDTGNISRSQMQKWINDGTYEQHRDEIEKAMREGKIVQ